MATAPNLPASRSRLPIIAVSLAAVAVALVVVMVIVVVSRRARPAFAQRSMTFAELGKLKRDVIAPAAGGVTISDATLRASLGLDDDDVITAVAGKPTTHDYDVTIAITRASTMGSTTIDVDLLRDHAPLLLRWQLTGELAIDRDATATASTSAAFGLTPADPDPLVATIHQVDPLHVVIPQATVDALIANPAAMMKSARIVPAVRNGNAHGFKLYAIRPRSLLNALGFENGDTITGVNGYEMTSPDAALAIYTKLRAVKDFSVDLERRGAPLIVSITVTP